MYTPSSSAVTVLYLILFLVVLRAFKRYLKISGISPFLSFNLDLYIVSIEQFFHLL